MRDAYVTKVKAVADELVRSRLLLPADAAAYVRAAEAARSIPDLFEQLAALLSAT